MKEQPEVLEDSEGSHLVGIKMIVVEAALRWRVVCSIVLIFSAAQTFGQCSNFNANYPSGLYSTTDGSWKTVTSCAWGGEYARYQVEQGAAYVWSNCYGSGFPSQLTVWDSAHTNSLAYSTSGCTAGRAAVSWTATFSGEVHVLISEDDCQSNTSCARIRWRRTSPPPPHPNNIACNAKAISVGSTCNFGTYNNAGATDSGIGTPSCGEYSGGDVWFKFDVPSSGSVQILTEELSLLYGSMSVYSGTCSSLTEIACDDYSGPGFMPMLSLSGLSGGSTIYIRFFAWRNYGTGEFSLCVTDPCSAPLPNDLPCDATMLSMNNGAPGSNSCANNESEPETPSCWAGGGNSSVWYKFTATSTGSTRIVVFPETIQSTQVALYEGNCAGDLSLLECSTSEAVECQAGAAMFSQLEASFLVSGQVYFIRVDGQNGDQGTFTIRVNSWLKDNVLNSQDCSGAIEVCGDRVRAADPGIQGIGSQCDFYSEGNCTGGEKNSIWYKVKIHATGRFRMILTPNDGSSSSCGSETDYDFLMWKTAGDGETTDCEGISADASYGLIACNYDYRGVSGVYDDGNAPPGYSTCFNNSFEPTMTLNEGDEILIVVQNYSTSTSGFEMDMSHSDPGMVGAVTPTTVYWDGNANSDWLSASNWGGCSTVPSCTVNAVVTPVGTEQPIVIGTKSVKNLSIRPGASLYLESGSVLKICGDFENYGTITASPNSKIIFEGTGVQHMKGEFSGESALNHLNVTKSSGQVLLESSVEIKGDFETSNSTCVFNLNGNTMTLEGSFKNSNGEGTFKIGGASAKIIFSGPYEQRYNQGSSALQLSQVEISKTGSAALHLFSDLIMVGTSSYLDLQHGIIKTTSNFQVSVENEAPLSVNAGNAGSYVEGKLQRAVANTGVYEFPLGNSEKGYQRAQIDFISNSVSILTGEFLSWSGEPVALNQSDCQTIFDLPALDNGYFNIEASNNPTSAVYDIKLFNNNYSNAMGSGFTVMKDSGSGFQLSGECEDSSSDEVHRTGLTGFSRFATAQASNPLPIELLHFTGEVRQEGNLLRWATSSEVNNEYFTIQRSYDGILFEDVVDLEGAGNSSAQLAYSFIDEEVVSGAGYYRLRQTDFDGTYSDSDVILLNRSEVMGLEHLQMYPNPTAGDLHIEFDQLYKERIAMNVFDVNGKKVFSRSALSQEGHNVHHLDVRHLDLGFYFLHIMTKEGKVITKSKFLKTE